MFSQETKYYSLDSLVHSEILKGLDSINSQLLLTSVTEGSLWLYDAENNGSWLVKAGTG